MKMVRGAFVAALAVLALTSPSAVRAAEAPLTVLCAGAASVVIERVAHEFERTHGRTVIVSEGTVGQLRARLAAGEHADVIVVSAPALAALDAAGDVVPGTAAVLGRTGIGVGVRSGTTAPDISTPEALKAALLAAPSIATMDAAAGSSSGAYFFALQQRMGIADALRAKTTLKQSGFSCELVAAGKADLCVQNISEIIPVQGVKVVPFPESLQNYITYAIAVPQRSVDPALARAFIADVTSPARAPLWKNAGLQQ
jgi:molybdate transport system substrate-binding protein